MDCSGSWAVTRSLCDRGRLSERPSRQGGLRYVDAARRNFATDDRRGAWGRLGAGGSLDRPLLRGPVAAKTYRGQHRSFFVFPYVLGLPIYVLSQSFLLSELVVLFLCVAAYGVARQLLPPRLSIAQFAGVLLAWGLASAGGFLLLFLFSIGPNPRALAG